VDRADVVKEIIEAFDRNRWLADLNFDNEEAGVLREQGHVNPTQIEVFRIVLAPFVELQCKQAKSGARAKSAEFVWQYPRADAA
jgi:hypothetical protein